MRHPPWLPAGELMPGTGKPQKITYDGREFSSITKLASFLGLSRSALQRRIEAGVPPEEWTKQESNLEKHLRKIKKHGRVELVGEYTGIYDKTKYKCLTHGEIHEAIPNNMASGQGLICCRNAKVLAHARQQSDMAHEKYLDLIKGRYELRGEWINTDTPVLHYCLKHQQEYLVKPGVISHNKSEMPCCGGEKTLAVARKKHEKAKATYDQRLADIGKVKRIGEYTGSKDSIDHLCLIHDEVHPALPGNLLKGQGLYCCQRERTGTDSVESAINGTLKVPDKPEWLYLYRLKRFPEYLKIGIAVDVSPNPDPNNPKILRGFDEEYGDQVALWFFENRIDAFLVEQAVLQATASSASIPEGLEETWAGAGEVRHAPEEELVDFIQRLCEEHSEIGRWQFVLANLKLPKRQREAVLRKISGEDG